MCVAWRRVGQIPGGEIEESKVLDGVMLNKDVTHPKMRRRIENPRIILLDCPIEYKKAESQMSIEVKGENDWNRILQIEEEYIKNMCDDIIRLKPDLVITEKGLSGAYRPCSDGMCPPPALPSADRPRRWPSAHPSSRSHQTSRSTT